MSSRFYSKHTPLSTEQLMARAPSIFATQASQKVSEKYAFIPTTTVVNLLGAEGWQPVFAAQSKARGDDNGDYMKHVIRFQHPDLRSGTALKVGDSFPEIILTNSHNGTSSFRFMAGLYRLVCSNGLAVSDATVASARIRHQGYRDDEVREAVATMKERLPLLGETVARFKEAQLSPELKLDFAREAVLLRWDSGKAPVDASQLLAPRRSEDAANDLWTTLNVVQENIVIGGLQGRTASTGKRARRMTTREVASVNGNLRLNRGIWALAEETLRKVG